MRVYVYDYCYIVKITISISSTKPNKNYKNYELTPTNKNKMMSYFKFRFRSGALIMQPGLVLQIEIVTTQSKQGRVWLCVKRRKAVHVRVRKTSTFFYWW